jgi:hypothetical protein
LSIDRRWVVFHGFPVWEKLSESSGLEAVAAQNMITDLGSLFDQTYVNWTIMLFLFLLEFDGSRQTCHTAAHDNHVVFHLLSGRQLNAEIKFDIF